MDMDQAAVFLAGSILTALGFIVFVIAVVVVNNIIYRWWKHLGWNLGVLGNANARFATPEELEQLPPKIEPTIDNKNEPKAKTN